MQRLENEDLCMAVFRRLSRIGFDIRNPRGEYAILQFVINYLSSFISNEQFAKDGYDVEMTKDSIKVLIDTSNTKEINVKLLKSNVDPLINGIEISTDNFENGSLKIYSNGNTGRIHFTENVVDTTENYIVDTQKEEFVYSYGVNYADREETLFSGKLSAIGTTIKNHEYFTFERLYPEMDQNSGVLNNIRRCFAPGVVKCVPKRGMDASIYDDVFLAFDVLKAERDKVLTPKTKKAKKLTKEAE